jgi:hypothetical protein
MEATYNFIITDLLWYSEDKEFIDGFASEFVNLGVKLEIEFLNDKSFTTKPLARVKKNLDKALEINQLKLNCLKAQDFEGAAAFRITERELSTQLKKGGFNLYKLNYNEFALYHVDVDKKNRKMKLTIFTNSSECVELIEEIRIKVES